MKNDLQEKFLIAFHGDMQKYFNHIEQSMISLLHIYLAIFALIGPATAFLKARYDIGLLIISCLLLIVGVLGFYILGMYIELRIRKIKVLEQIALITHKICKSSFLQEGWILMIDSLEKCPPYLRRPSSEWYTIIFFSFLNSMSISLSLSIFIAHIKLVTAIGVLILIVILLWAVLFLLQFAWATRYTYTYDVIRESRYGVKNLYDLLSSPYFPKLFLPLDKIASYIEEKLKPWLISRLIGEFEVKPLNNRCIFCKVIKNNKTFISEDKFSFSKWDEHPVSEGHALVIPKRHVSNLFDLSHKEVMSLYILLRRVRAILQDRYKPDGFNIGINEGKAAGQTISHVHIHIIPRYKGDVARPEGGVRHVIPGKGFYVNGKKGRFNSKKT